MLKHPLRFEPQGVFYVKEPFSLSDYVIVTMEIIALPPMVGFGMRNVQILLWKQKYA